MQIDANSPVITAPQPKATSLVERTNADKFPENEKSAPSAAKSAVHRPTRNAAASTLFYAQQAASKPSPAETKTNEAVDAFLEYMDKTSTELWRERILSSLGLTEESLAALSPEERRAVEEKIIQIIREEIEKSAKESAKAAEVENLTKQTKTAAAANISSLQKLDPKVAEMAELPAEIYHAYTETMQKLEAEDQKQQDRLTRLSAR